VKGPKALDDLTVEEETGWMLIADAIYCLQHLREAFSKSEK
jgi:hypothetical protein